MGLGDRRLTPLTADQIVPRSLGGAGAPGNLRVLCAECNVGKANWCTVPSVTRYRFGRGEEPLAGLLWGFPPVVSGISGGILAPFRCNCFHRRGYVDDAGLAAYAASIECRFGLVCDLAGVPGHLFPKGYDRP